MSGKAKKPEWYTIREAAEYLGVGEPTIYRWMRDEKLTYRKVGDSTRFLQQDLDAMIQVFPNKSDTGLIAQYCSVCRCDDLVEGEIQSSGKIYFKPAKTKFWTFSDSNVKTRALICTSCGYINLFGDTKKLLSIRKEKSPQSGEENDAG